MIQTTVAFLKIPVSDINFAAAEGLIIASLNKAGLKHRSIDVVLGEEDLASVYANLSGTPALETIFCTTLAQLSHKTLCAFMISGEGAVEKVYRLKGTKTEPMECSPDSWRYRLAMVIGVRHVRLFKPDGTPIVTIVDNLVHAPSSEDVLRNLKVFSKYFS